MPACGVRHSPDSMGARGGGRSGGSPRRQRADGNCGDFSAKKLTKNSRKTRQYVTTLIILDGKIQNNIFFETPSGLSVF